jgi:hypothetical protein
VMWLLHNTTLTGAVVYAGYRLIRILSLHLEKFKTSGERYASVKVGIYRVSQRERERETGEAQRIMHLH